MRTLLFFLIVLFLLVVGQEKKEIPVKDEEYEYELYGIWIDTRIPDNVSPEVYVSQGEDESIFLKEGCFFK